MPGRVLRDPLTLVSNSSYFRRDRLTALLANERHRFVAEHPRSEELFRESKRTVLRGVPMSWMSAWHGGFPIFLSHAEGAVLTDVDGIAYADFCLGDTAALGSGVYDAGRGLQRRGRRGAVAAE